MRLFAVLGRKAQPGDCIALIGNLGSGKTVVAKGIAAGLGIPREEVASPTFVLMTVHEGRLPMYHFDAYRLGDADELLATGAEDALYGNGVSVVEWADRVAGALPADRLEVRIRITGVAGRRFDLAPTGPRSAHWLASAFDEMAVGSTPRWRCAARPEETR